MSDDYPTEETLQKIEKWPYDDFRGLLEFLVDSWIVAYGRTWRGVNYEWIFTTGGWSGNEELIAAFQKNHICWSMLWYSSSRGGMYQFILADDSKIRFR